MDFKFFCKIIIDRLFLCQPNCTKNKEMRAKIKNLATLGLISNNPRPKIKIVVVPVTLPTCTLFLVLKKTKIFLFEKIPLQFQ
jgi:hypothetical protein